MLALQLFVWLIPRIVVSYNPTLFNVTISNSSGSYFISQERDDFYNGEIRCNSTQLCHIKCIHLYSCHRINVYCSNPNLCVLDCDGDSSCRGVNLYISSNHNTINCIGSSSCTANIGPNFYFNIYTDYKNYSSSNTILTCSHGGSCNKMQIVDIYTENGYNPSKFKILCIDVFLACMLDINSSLTVPNVINATGEYYFGIGSYLDIECSHNLLCSIDCTGGGCHQSSIDCGNADECNILCKGFGASACDMMNIKAQNNKQFTLICSKGYYTCGHSMIQVENVKDVNINCTGSVNCYHTKVQLNSITNAVFNCGGGTNGACTQMSLDINLVDNITVKCNNYKSCNKLSILSYGNKDTLNLVCSGLKSCQESQICVDNDNILNIDCCGDHSCNGNSFCTNYNYTLGTINCACGAFEACINMTVIPPTAAPTLSYNLATLSFPYVQNDVLQLYNKSFETSSADFGYQPSDHMINGLLILPMNTTYSYECNGGEPKNKNIYINYIKNNKHIEQDFIMIIDRGNCYFYDKVQIAQSLGAKGVIICDDRNQELFAMSKSNNIADNITIPSVLLQKTNCQLLYQHLGVLNWDPQIANDINETMYPSANNITWTLAQIVWGVPISGTPTNDPTTLARDNLTTSTKSANNTTTISTTFTLESTTKWATTDRDTTWTTTTTKSATLTTGSTITSNTSNTSTAGSTTSTTSTLTTELTTSNTTESTTSTTLTTGSTITPNTSTTGSTTASITISTTSST
eukprot:148841_1